MMSKIDSRTSPVRAFCLVFATTAMTVALAADPPAHVRAPLSRRPRTA
jgi:hypothetical protein